MKILIIIPAFNEGESISALLNEISDLGLEAVVINDASTDNTEQIAAKHEFPVINLPLNLGIGGAVQTGFLYALRNNYDVVVQIDGDGQHDPAQLRFLTEKIIRGEGDCIIGSRYIPGEEDKNYKTPFARRLGMMFSTRILQLSTGVLVYDTTSGFRALNRSAYEYFSRTYPVDHPEAEALFMLHRKGFKIKEVPIVMRSRVNGHSMFGLVRSILYPFRVVVGFIGLIGSKA